VLVAAGGDEGDEEDGEVVGGVDDGGGGDGAEAEADGGENKGDAEKEGEDRPGKGGLLAVDEGEEDAGEDGGEEEAVAGEGVGALPGLAGGVGAGEAEPIVGDGEGGEEEAAEEDLFEEGSKEDAEDGDEPDSGAAVEEGVDGELFGHIDVVRQALDNGGEDEAEGDEAEGVAGDGGGVPLQAEEEGALPERGKGEEGGDEGEDVGEGFRRDEQAGVEIKRMGWVADEDGDGLGKEEEEGGYGEEEERVAEVGDAGGGLGAGAVGGFVGGWKGDGVAFGQQRGEGEVVGFGVLGELCGDGWTGDGGYGEKESLHFPFDALRLLRVRSRWRQERVAGLRSR